MQRYQTNRGNRSQSYIVPAPIGGLNRRDSLDTMADIDAIVLDNYIPSDNSLKLRKGYQLYANTGGAICTLVEYKKGKLSRFIGIGNSKAYDLTSVPDDKNANEYEDVSFKENFCQTQQYKDRLFFVNGEDIPKVFRIDEETNEDVFEDWGFSAEGLTPEHIVNIGLSKQRLWFVEKNSLRVWYPSVAGNIAGELQKFDLSQVSSYGGELISVVSWTQDGGQGIDDLTVFITSSGEALVYGGTNPNSADDWMLKGSYKISKPIGYRCAMQYQGDVVVVSEDGYIPLSKALPIERANASQIAFSDKIRGLVLERTATGKKKKGWQTIIYDRGGIAIFNVPLGAGFEQHVINLNKGVWCRFTNIRSFCWAQLGDRIYFGSDNAVFLFDEGYSDNGNNIIGHVEQAFNGFGSQNLKKIQMLNPRTKSSKSYELMIYTNMDYEELSLPYVQNIDNESITKWSCLSTPIGTKWSSLSRPIGTKWSTLKGTVKSQWIASSATGYKASIVFKTSTKGNIVEWFDTGIRYEQGTGIL